MKTVFQLRPALLLLALLGILTPAIGDQGAPAKIKAEIERLQQSLSGKPDSDPQWKDAKPGIGASLQQAADNLSANRLYVSLEALSDTLTSFRGLELATGKTESELLKEGLPGIETELKKARLELAALDQRNSQDGRDAIPSAIHALSEKAEGQAGPLMEGGRGFALLNDAVTADDRANNFSSALYYAGNAEAQTELAAFYETLHLMPGGSPISLRSIAPELQSLQERVTASFQPPRSVEHHADFIRLNATLKLAGELDAKQRYAGALYQYLDATQQFGMLDAVAPDEAKQSELKSFIEKEHQELSDSKQDSSIAQLFLERAEARLSKSPSANGWKTTEVIVEQVLPAYFAALKSSPPQDHPAVAGVTVTLVRWPYT